MAHLALYVLRILFFRKKRPKEIEKKSGKSCWPSYHPLTSRLLTKNCGANSAFQGQSTKAPSSFRCPYLRPEAIFTFFSPTFHPRLHPLHEQFSFFPPTCNHRYHQERGNSIYLPLKVHHWQFQRWVQQRLQTFPTFFPSSLHFSLKHFFFSKIYLPPFPPPSKCAGVLFYLEMAGRQRERQKKKMLAAGRSFSDWSLSVLPPGTPPPGATDGATGRKVERERRMVGRERERTVVNATLLASTSRQASSHFVLCWPWFLRGAAFFPSLFCCLAQKKRKNSAIPDCVLIDSVSGIWPCHWQCHR